MLSLMFICATLTGCLGEKNSEDLGGVGDYTVTWNQENFRSIEGTEFMDDGGNLTLKFVLGADDVMEEGYTHYLVEFIVNSAMLLGNARVGSNHVRSGLMAPSRHDLDSRL